MIPSLPDPGLHQRNLGALARARNVGLVLLLVLPLGLWAVFDRQGRRLDGLAARGVVTVATVTAHTRQQGVDYTTYAYTRDGSMHTWSVSRADAPLAPGKSFSILVHPDVPSFSRPTTAHARVAAEAVAQRRFTRNAVGGIAAVLALVALAFDLQLRRLRSGETMTLRARLAIAGVMVVPPILLVSAWHARDALARGQSVAPVAMTFALLVVPLVVIGLHARQHGFDRTRVVLRKLSPVMAGLAGVAAVMRLVVFLFDR